jgi:hypothetical protein
MSIQTIESTMAEVRINIVRDFRELIVWVFGGVVQTFQRQPVVAILCVIFLFPIWIIWAVIEIFLPSPS